MVKIAPYGSWTSPITAAQVATARSGPQWVGIAGGHVWWAEARPTEGGRLALCRATPGGAVQEVLGAPWNVRNRVHEYGGRPWTVFDTPNGSRLVFTDWADQRWYVVDPDSGDAPTPISPEPARHHGIRYAVPAASPDRTELWCVRETVTGDRPTDVRRDLVAIPLSGAAAADPDAVRVLSASHHFLTGPKPSPDGLRVAWLGWNHPAMPWDGTQLCVADVNADGTLGEHRVVAGGPTEAVCQVEWEGADTLVALTDPQGWWNLYRIDLAGDPTPVPLAAVEAELGGPLWQIGSRWFQPLGGGRYAVIRDWRLAVADATAGTVVDMAVDLPVWYDLAVADGVLVGVAGSAIRDEAVVWLDLATGALTEITAQPADMPDPAYLPQPVLRTFTVGDGHTVPAFLYLPVNPEYTAPDGELPPLIVHAHGGPTGAFAPAFAPTVAYFTSRGFAFVAVDYGGSTGYGRQFRERLRDQWGVVDVADCSSVAQALAAEGTVDGDRMAIRGGSAGGWTTAASLTSVRTYRCGTVMFPVLDATGWIEQTHDFESRYLDGLIGSLPEHADRYARRSPARHADRLAGPVLMLQGLDDQICPPVQADQFMAGLAGTGIPHGYLRFEGEQHGFRKAETITAATEAELSFYGQALGFTTPGVPVLELRG